jgi:hypothetical protein
MQFRVLLVRGRAHKDRYGVARILVASSREGKFHHYAMGGIYRSITEKMFEANERDAMIAYIAGLRMQGYTPLEGVPSW